MLESVSKIKAFFLHTLLFLFPLFFLPITQEYFLTNKVFFLIFGALFIVLLTVLEMLLSKKITITWPSINTLITTFLLLVGASVLFMSPNKVQALLHANYGLGFLIALVIIYLTLLKKTEKPLTTVFYSACVMGGLAILFFINPFAKMTLPNYLGFLKSSIFSPLGSQLDQAVFLGYFAVTSISAMIMLFMKKRNVSRSFLSPLSIICTAIIILGCILSVTNIISSINPPAPVADQQQIAQFELPPMETSYLASIETLKSPKSAVFGVGLDNYSVAFTSSKPASYNTTPQWNRNFRASSNTFFTIFTETGLVSMLVFIFILFSAFRLVKRKKEPIANHDEIIDLEQDRNVLTVGMIYLIAVFLLLPISLPLFFLLFVTLAQITKFDTAKKVQTIQIGSYPLFYVPFAILIVILVGITGYGASRAYASEYSFKLAIDALQKNDGQAVYKLHRQAISQNNYIERYRINFSQLNLLIANNIAKKGDALTKDDRSTIAQAVQVAIAEAKAVVSLNPQRASNWENLGLIYRQIINVAQNADAWTVSSYQRAIILDPNNPLLRLSLGGVYYGLGRYDDAVSLFSQAVALKPTLANFRYNLAHAYYQNKQYVKAYIELQNTISLLPDNKSEDYKKAQKELEMFKEKVEEESATEGAQLKNTDEQTQTPLNLPATPEASISPKIQLPEGVEPPISSPSAQ